MRGALAIYARSHREGFRRSAMNYFTDEKMLIESDNNVLVLTTHRVRYDAIGKGSGWADRTELVSIMLEELSSCAITRTSYPLLLLLALAGLVLAILVEGGSIVGIALAVLFAGGFFLSQRQVLLLTSSGGGKIQINTANMSLQAVREFVDEIESAKNQRFIE
jgi:hypothetical protein